MEIGNWYIYETKNLVNGKTYIGQRKCPKNKTPETDIGYMGSGKILKEAVKKYGAENLKKRILIKDIYCKQIINNLEKDFISIYKELGKAEYNISDGGQGGNLGEKWLSILQDATQKTTHREKISQSNKGKLHSKEWSLKISKSLMGKSLSEEHKQHISKTLTGTKLSDERKQSISNALKMKKKPKRSEEHCRNLSLSHTGKVLSVETKRKIGLAISRAYQGANNPSAKSVRCIETGDVFTTIAEASKKSGCCAQGISFCCHKKIDNIKRSHWEFV